MSGGVQSEALYYLRNALSKTGQDLPDLEMQWLSSQGFAQGDLDSRWFNYLKSGGSVPTALSGLLNAKYANWIPYIPPLNRFTQDIDWTVPSVKGGPQSFTGFPGAGNDFRQGGNAVVCYAPNQAGVLVAMSSTAFRRTDRGEMQYPSINTGLLWNRDLTNAVWVKTNATATKNQVGADGAANSASLITATANNGTILQTFTSSVFDRAFQIDVKRVSGTGTLEATIDGGTTWQTITPASSSYDVMSPKVIFQAAVTNPVVGFRIGTSGDSFAVDFALLIVPPANWPSLAPIHARPITTTATVQTFIERAYASFPDSSPLSIIARGAFGFYWQGRASRNGGYPMTSASKIFLNAVQGTGEVVFKNGASGATQTTAGVWKFDNALTQVNKIAGWCDATNLRMACNGVLAGAATGTLGLDTALDHFDLGTNGSGANSIFGINERFAMGPNLVFTDTELVSMTT